MRPFMFHFRRHEMRFHVSWIGDSIWVWDEVMRVPVSNPEYVDGYAVRWEFPTRAAAKEIADTLNQRVEHPELTRAGGKLVTA
jgi:hypothetical protein